MFRFSTIEEKHLLGFLKAGKLDDFLDEIFQQFWELSPKVQFELILYIKSRRRYPNLRVISETFGIGAEDAKSFLKGSFREFLVPVVGRNSGIVRGLSVRNLKGIITNMKHLETSMKRIKKFLREGFGLFFDDEFSGESYMLPALVSLYVNNVPHGLIFTGSLDSRGNVLEVNAITEKRTLAEKEGYRLADPLRIGNIRDIKDHLDADCHNVPFFVTNTPASSGEYEEFRNFLSYTPVKEEKLELFETLNGMDWKDLTIVTGQLPQSQERWREIAVEFFSKLRRIEGTLEGRYHLHIGIKGPSTLSLCLGALFGGQRPFTFYHFQKGLYYPLTVDDPRTLKERVSGYRHIIWEFEEGSNVLVIILALAHHEPEADARDATKNLSPSYLIVRHRKSGNIPLKDIKEVARECSSLIQDIRKRRRFDKFLFFLSMPVSVAFLVGVAFGHWNSGEIYNYFGEGLYTKVADLLALREIREDKVEIPR